MAKRQILMVRALTAEEQGIIEYHAQGNEHKPFTERRSRILLASSAGKPPIQIATDLNIDDETVRRAIRDFNQRGTIALTEGSHRPYRTRNLFVPGGRERLLEILHRHPKEYGFYTDEWTLELIADAAFASGLTTSRVCDETIRNAFIRLATPWRHIKRLMLRERCKVPSPHRPSSD
ncbi:helix-turn-helix domain-containing protein [Chloroflexales bacterium ZM16-3]|nr:helix-turn-helix domain-containing protein [Chloroflexales bacterium ZM16-3]